MTLSDQARLVAIDVVLRRILEDLGEGPFDKRCEVQGERYRDIPQTTWLELEGFGYVEPVHAFGNPAFHLTGAGWIAALKASGSFETQRDRAVTLRAALKDVVKGRPLNGAITDVRTLAGTTGLPEAWVRNALNARLLQLLWTWDHLDVAIENGGSAIRVPARFGSRRLRFEAGPFPDPDVR